LYLIPELLFIMLQYSLLLFGIALTVYLWNLDVSVAEVVLVITSIGFAFYICIAVVATISNDCPFRTTLSILLHRILPWVKASTTLAYVRLSRRAIRPQLGTESATEHDFFKTLTGGTNIPSDVGEDPSKNDHPITLSSPVLWRNDPLFTFSVRKDIAASAGFWLLEESTDFSTASTVAAVFPEFQWPSHYYSTTALIRLRDTYVGCFRAPEFNESAHLEVPQSAAAYYVLYRTQLIWSASKGLEVEVGKLPPDLPRDLYIRMT
jgi:hypothetical protein